MPFPRFLRDCLGSTPRGPPFHPVRDGLLLAHGPPKPQLAAPAVNIK